MTLEPGALPISELQIWLTERGGLHDVCISSLKIDVGCRSVVLLSEDWNFAFEGIDGYVPMPGSLHFHDVSLITIGVDISDEIIVSNAAVSQISEKLHLLISLRYGALSDEVPIRIQFESYTFCSSTSV